MANRDVSQLVSPLHMGDFAGGNYTDVEPDGTTVAKGDATCWNDLRVAIGTTTVNGSSPPTDALFKNDGNVITGDAYALSFLSTTQGNLTLPDNIVFDTSADFTFEFWVRPVVATQNNIECVRKQSVFELDFVGSNQFNLNVSGIGSSTGSLQFNRGSWNHVAIIHDSTEGEINLYLNNQLNISLSGAPVDNAEDFTFNRQETLYDVDYIAYWDKVLTAVELTARYNAGAGQQLLGNEVGLKGLWELNNGSGTTATEKTGISDDGVISGGSEGSEWDWITGHIGNSSPATRGVILKYFSPTANNEVYFEAQLPHSWIEGSTLKPHIHWIPNEDGGAGERVTWKMEYTFSDIGEVFPDTQILTGSTNIYDEDLVKNKHYLTSFGDLDATGKKLSSMLVCRVWRDADNDDYSDFAGALEIDIHYQINMFGSRQEFVK